MSQRPKAAKREVIELSDDSDSPEVIDLSSSPLRPSHRPAAERSSRPTELPRSSVPAKLESPLSISKTIASPRRGVRGRSETGNHEVEEDSIVTQLSRENEREETPTASQVVREAIVREAAEAILSQMQLSRTAEAHHDPSPVLSEPEASDDQQDESNNEQAPPAPSSIGTDSPLVPRRKKRQHYRELSRELQRTFMSDEELQDALRSLKEDMEEYHRTTTYYKLLETRAAVAERSKSSFIDKMDPFATMKSVMVLGTATQGLPLDGITYEKANYWVCDVYNIYCHANHSRLLRVANLLRRL